MSEYQSKDPRGTSFQKFLEKKAWAFLLKRDLFRLCHPPPLCFIKHIFPQSWEAGTGYNFSHGLEQLVSFLEHLVVAYFWEGIFGSVSSPSVVLLHKI